MTETIETKSLLEQRRAIEVATAKQIAELLQQREQRIANIAAEQVWLDKIAVELKDLGHKRPRAKAAKKATVRSHG